MEIKPKTRGYIACAAVGCSNNQKNCTLSFFRFPKNIESARKWAVACGRKDLLRKDNLYTSYRICGAHFENRMFLNDLKNRLHQNVIPSRFSHLESFSQESGSCISETMQTDCQIKVERVIAFTQEEMVIPNKISKIESAHSDFLVPVKIEIEEVSCTPDFLFPSTSSQTSPMLLSKDSTQTSEISTQTSQNLLDSTPREEYYKDVIIQQRQEITRMKKEIEELKQERTIDHINLEEFKGLVNKFCPKELAILINVQISEAQKED